MKLILVFITFIIASSLAIIKSDIPTHCFGHQIVGNWIFYQTEAAPKTLAELYQHKCGIRDHTKVSDIGRPRVDKTQFSNSFQITLDKDHKVTVTKSFPGFKGSKSGKWTMVYDEGFEFNLGTKDTSEFSSYFSFLKFTKNDFSINTIKSKHFSHCYEALIGWFHTDKDKWGCFYGHKLVEDYKKPTNGEADDKLLVVENVIKAAFIEKETKEENVESLKEIDNEKNLFVKTLDSGRFMQMEFENKLENKMNNKLTVKNKSLLSLNAEFTNHEEVVERINSMNLSWKAEVYSEFKGMTIAEINKFSGRIGKGETEKFDEMNLNINTDTNTNTKKLRNNNSEFKAAKLSFRVRSRRNSKSLQQINYKSVMSTPKSQGHCGSCFAISTNTAMEARPRLKYSKIIEKYYPNNVFEISLDHVLKCSFYNQGCKGGYSYLTGKFFKEFEVMTRDCFDGETCSNSCKTKGEKKGKLNIKVDDYYYVGNYYGYTNEDNIYEDLRDNGPMVISLAPSYLFSSYKSGIFDGDGNTLKALNVRKPEWQKVDHSVVLAGYGVENGVEYWLIQNSWGQYWGDSGYMKLRKGKNLINIESLAESVKVSVTEN